MINRGHSQNLLDLSPWSLGIALMLVSIMVNFIFIFRTSWIPSISLVMVVVIGYYWRRDVIRERSFLRCHTRIISGSIMCSIGLFILSEVIFFSRFFDALFYNLFGGDVSSRLFGVAFLDPLRLPLLNTILLVSSRIITTWAHVIAYNRIFVEGCVIWSMILGGYFMGVQYFEFRTSEFDMGSGIYGSCFFGLTGFHGLHVIVGSRLLIITLIRGGNQFFGKYVGLDCSFIYWHFVDVVWIVVMIFVYIVPVAL